MKMEKSSVPKAEPWGTPEPTKLAADLALSTKACVSFNVKDNHSGTPYECVTKPNSFMEEQRMESCIWGHHICKKYWIQLLERWCSAWGSLKIRYTHIQLPSWKGELLLNTHHEGYPDCVRSFCDEEVPLNNFHAFNFRIFWKCYNLKGTVLH